MGVVAGVLTLVVVIAVAFALLTGGLLSVSGPSAPVGTPPAEQADPTPATTAGSDPAPQATEASSQDPAPGPSVRPSGPAGSAAPPVTGGPVFPTEPSPTSQFTGTGLQDNRLYSVVGTPASLSCTDPPLDRPGVPDEQLAPLAEEIVACLVQALSPGLAEQGIELTTPLVETYAADVETPCGAVTVERYPAYYCSFDTTIYLNELTDDTAFNYAELTRGYWLIVAHELGHHVQLVSGIFPGYTQQWTEADTEEQDELTRRLELQATCFAGVQLNLMAGSLQLTGDTAEELQRYALNNNDEVTGTTDHGDAESTAFWLDQGFLRGWASFGHCRTWSADDADVS